MFSFPVYVKRWKSTLRMYSTDRPWTIVKCFHFQILLVERVPCCYDMYKKRKFTREMGQKAVYTTTYVDLYMTSGLLRQESVIFTHTREGFYRNARKRPYSLSSRPANGTRHLRSFYRRNVAKMSKNIDIITSKMKK